GSSSDLAILNFPQLCMAVWSERHVMQLDKRLLKLARTLWLSVSSRSAGPQKILNRHYVFFSFKCAWVVFECCCSFDGCIVSFDSTEEQTTHTANSSPSRSEEHTSELQSHLNLVC